MVAKTKQSLFIQRKTIFDYLQAGMAPRMIQSKLKMTQAMYYDNLAKFQEGYELFPDDGCKTPLTISTIYRSAVQNKVYLMELLGIGKTKVADILGYSRTNINNINKRMAELEIGCLENTYIEVKLTVGTTGVYFMERQEYARIPVEDYYINLGRELDKYETDIQYVNLFSVADRFDNHNNDFIVAANNITNRIRVIDPYPIRPYQNDKYETRKEYEEGRQKFAEYKKKNP